MTEEQASKARSQSREFPETMEILKKVRDALAAKLFQTKLSERDAREDIYTRVQAIDALMDEMNAILTGIKSEKDYTEYAERVATTEK